MAETATGKLRAAALSRSARLVATTRVQLAGKAKAQTAQTAKARTTKVTIPLAGKPAKLVAAAAPQIALALPLALTPAAPTSIKAWTITRRTAFLAELAATANVRMAAKAAGLPETGAYTLRRTLPEFRAAWGDALCEGYARLELMMLERAINGLSRSAHEADAMTTRIEEFSNKLALTLLAAHRANVRELRELRDARAAKSRPGANAASFTAVDDAAARARLAAKFQDMHDRMNAGDNAHDGHTDNADA